MTQEVKALATRAADPSLSPGTHRMEVERTNPCKLSSILTILWTMAHTPMCTRASVNWFKHFNKMENRKDTSILDLKK